MDLLLAVDHDVAPSAAAFISTWNADPASAGVAVAANEHPVNDLGVEFLDAFIVTLNAIAPAVAAHAIYDLIRSKFERADDGKLEFEQAALPDGTKVTRISITRRS